MEKARYITLLNLLDDVLINVAEEKDAAVLQVKLQALIIYNGGFE